MLLNLANLRSELKQKIKNTGVSNARIDRWLNLSIEEVAHSLEPEHLLKESTFSTTANVRKYYIEAAYNKIISVVDVTQDWIIYPETEVNLELYDPDRSDGGTPWFYSEYGIENVKAQPSSAVEVRIVSNSASDTAEKVRINGTVDGVEDTELLSLNGTTVVTGSKQFTNIQSVIKDNTTVGKVTVDLNDASNTEIAVFGPAQLDVYYQPIYLTPVPSDARSIRVRYIRQPRHMVNVEDMPDLPKPYHELVLFGAAVRAHRDLFRPDLAEDVRTREYKPMLKRFKEEMGNRRGIKAPVIRGMFNGGRYRVLGHTKDRDWG